MEELDKLKNDWKKGGNKFPKFSEQEIYAMLHKRSSSIVKWILIISVIEFVFWIALSLLLRDNPQMRKMNDLNLSKIIIPLEIINYVIISVFVILFYKNYIKIKVTDNAKTLMKSILSTRRW